MTIIPYLKSVRVLIGAAVLLFWCASSAHAQWVPNPTDSTGTDIFYNGGRVGIGTNNPSSLFQVNGGNISQVSSGTLGLPTSRWSSIGDAPGLFPNVGVTYGSNYNWDSRNLLVGLIDGTNGKDGLIAWQDQTSTSSTVGSRLRFGFINGVGSAATLNERMTILANGNVGIGTSNPSVKLDVVGDIEAFSGDFFGSVETSNLNIVGSQASPVIPEITFTTPSVGFFPGPTKARIRAENELDMEISLDNNGPSIVLEANSTLPTATISPEPELSEIINIDALSNSTYNGSTQSGQVAQGYIPGRSTVLPLPGSTIDPGDLTLTSGNNGAGDIVLNADDIRLNGTVTGFTASSSSFNGNVTVTGSLGVGTTSPAAKLEVKNGNFAQVSSGTLGLPSSRWSSIGDPPGLFPNVGVTYGSNYNWDSRNLLVGLIDGPNGKDGLIAWQDQTATDSTAGNRLRLGFIQGFGQDATLKERMTVLSNGNVGIGTENPTDMLEVAGSGTFQNNVRVLGSSPHIFLGDSTAGFSNIISQKSLLIQTTNDNSGLTLRGSQNVIIQSDEFIGINVGAANLSLGNLGTSLSAGFSDGAGSGDLLITAGGSFSGAFGSPDTKAGNVRIDGGPAVNRDSIGHIILGGTNGRVGIGDEDPVYKLELPNDPDPAIGRARANAWVIYSTGARVSNAQPVQKARELITKLEGQEFDWNGGNKGSRYAKGRHDYGFVAEDLARVMPEAVDYAPDGQTAVGVNPMAIVPVLVEALKEQNQEIAELRQEAQKVQALEERLERLEALLARQATDPAQPAVQPGEAPRNNVEQNRPNPYSKGTVIGYTLQPEVQNAVIMVFDMQGRSVTQITLKNRGKGEVELGQGLLTPGLYYYSLVADGREVATRRMIVSQQ